MTAPEVRLSRRDLRLAAVLVMALAAAIVLRFALLDAAALRDACGASQIGVCGFRAGLRDLLEHQPLGIASVVLGAAAYLSRGSWPAAAALLFGAVGLVLYNFESGAVGALLGLMALAAAKARTASAAP